MTQVVNPDEVMRVNYGKHTIPVNVLYEVRNQLVITVHPDMTIEARAPEGSEPHLVQKKLDEKASWMWNQLDFFEQYQPLQPPRRFVNGETHIYLGRQYRLKIDQSSNEQVRLVGKFFRIETRDPEYKEKIKNLMQDWYHKHAKVLITRRLNFYLPDVQRYGSEKPIVRIRRMKKRWGSCTSDGVMTFNTELVKAPIDCLDYVLVHELCHLVHVNHSPEFYRLLGVIMPDWQKRKERLSRVTI